MERIVTGRTAVKVAVVALAIGVAGTPVARTEVRPLAVGGFEVVQETTVPGTPEEVYDAFTGDITPWWDHSFSKHPKRIFLDPHPGGAFYELFDDQGNGALHATVIYADRGKRLRFTGPLGYSGFPISMVHTVNFVGVEDGKSTRVTVLVRAAGENKDGWAEGVDGVWHHFLVERFTAYMKALAAAHGEGSEGKEGKAEEGGGKGGDRAPAKPPEGGAPPP